MQKHLLFSQKIRKYQGQYVAASGGRVVASGKTPKEAFALARKISGKNPEGIYYIPTKKDLITALCVFHIFN